MTNSELRDAVVHDKLVAILRGTDGDATYEAAMALLDAGVTIIEIPLTVPGALDAITRVSRSAPSHALIGAGTVLTTTQVEQAVASGAQYIVTPSVAPSVGYACERDIAVLAGAFTPSEVHSCLESGVAGVKLFPASVGGPGYLKALLDPFPTAPLIPVGGVSLDTVLPYLEAGAIGIGVGGPLVGDAASPGGDLAGLAKRAKAYLAGVAS